ncbi:MAG: NADH-quinone oxidoreductase subunit NuoH [Deltaproteobacteria bacterium]|nr:NADH-quinone oxidoreductase subunit NuoH [Deltaproteobacteria bacterium]
MKRVLALVLLAAGCGGRNRGEDLLFVIDVSPRSVELGDHCQILGDGFPVGKTAEVTFEGTRTVPGKAPERSWSTTVQATAVSGEQVEFTLTDAVLAKFGNDHVTFEGDVEVSFRASDLEVKGEIEDVRLDFHAPTANRLAARLGREAAAKDALVYMGIVPTRQPPESGGIQVERLERTGRAEEAGVKVGDVIVGLGGQTIASLSDLVPAGGSEREQIEVVRAGTTERLTLDVDFSEYKPRIPPDVVGAIVLVVIATIALLLFLAPTAGVITWVERRVWARMQSRVGPNRVGPQGFLQWLADGIKAITKEDVVPKEADGTMFRLAPYLVFMGVAATFVIMPFGQFVIPADLDIGILYAVAVTAYVTIGLMMGGWASNNKWSLLGGIRSAAQIVSYEIPAAIAIVCVVMITGTLRMQGIVQAQGGWPWQWLIFSSPMTFVLFFLYFTAALAEANRTPFDLPEAESELVAGYSTEYSGMRYLFFFFAEWANVFVMCAFSTTLFLGGWQLPGVSPAQQEASTLLQILGCVSFLVKSWILIFVVIWIRATLPRIRIDQMMGMCWKVLVPGSFVLFLMTGAWLLWDKPPIVETVTSLLMFAIGCAILVQFGRRVVYNYRTSNRGMQALRLSPFA